MKCNICPLHEECDDAKERLVEYYGSELRITVLDMLSDFCPLVPGGDIRKVFEKEVDSILDI